MERTNAQWLADLSSQDSESALEELRKILVRSLHYSLSSKISRDDFDSLVEDFAQDAIIRIMGNLNTFRGESKFTTWAQKIAIRVAFSELRKLRWKNITLEDILPDTDSDYVPMILADQNPDPEAQVTRQSMLATVMRLVDEELTDKQSQAMQAIFIGGMPLEEVASRMDTNRNALYKVIYDARKRLKQRLSEEGLSPEEILAIFDH